MSTSMCLVTKTRTLNFKGKQIGNKHMHHILKFIILLGAMYVQYSTVIRIFHVINFASNGSIRYHFCGPDTVWSLVLFSGQIRISENQCCGSGVYPGRIFSIPHPGSEFFQSRIPDPNFFHPGSVFSPSQVLVRIKEFKCFNLKYSF